LLLKKDNDAGVLLLLLMAFPVSRSSTPDIFDQQPTGGASGMVDHQQVNSIA